MHRWGKTETGVRSTNQLISRQCETLSWGLKTTSNLLHQRHSTRLQQTTNRSQIIHLRIVGPAHHLLLVMEKKKLISRYLSWRARRPIIRWQRQKSQSTLRQLILSVSLHHSTSQSQTSRLNQFQTLKKPELVCQIMLRRRILIWLRKNRKLKSLP